MKKNNFYSQAQEWWEVSCNPDPQIATTEEMNEQLEQFRWERKARSSVYCNRFNHDNHSKDIEKFWKKWIKGNHFWHSKNKRWYLKTPN